MSLDVYLQGEERTVPCYCGDCGLAHERVTAPTFYSANITHNLNKMADEAGIYQHLWRPEELGIQTAKELIEPLTKGLAELVARPEHYSQWDAPNGWGLHEHLVRFVREYLAACHEYPDARVRASR